MRPRRIALLFHEQDTRVRPETTGVAGLIPTWEADGHTVIPLYGTGVFEPADLVLVHVDLSVVPEAYLDFAARYPVALNGRVRDIRKSTFSPGLLRAGDPWKGPVIVKSDRNYGGHPEALRGVARMDGQGLLPSFGSPLDYEIYDSLGEVPPDRFESPDLVVQAFLPEMEDGRFFVRSYAFLGDRHTTQRAGADEPIVKGQTVTSTEPAEPHPDIVALRHRLGFDYGKFDYVVRDGAAVILDINKTPGAIYRASPRILENRRIRAQGLYGFFRD
ncbi:MAG: hypothetical protein IPL96_16935 [Holophagaceae bacterium]|nr:hypothetical protein [Holophagaceae bacterium]